jgi:hypothetical protein
MNTFTPVRNSHGERGRTTRSPMSPRRCRSALLLILLVETIVAPPSSCPSPPSPYCNDGNACELGIGSNSEEWASCGANCGSCSLCSPQTNTYGCRSNVDDFEDDTGPLTIELQNSDCVALNAPLQGSPSLIPFSLSWRGSGQSICWDERFNHDLSSNSGSFYMIYGGHPSHGGLYSSDSAIVLIAKHACGALA